MAISAERVSEKILQTDHPSIPASHHERKASFSDVERAVLSALFVDEPTPQSTMQTDTTTINPFRSLNNEMLFSVPLGLSTDAGNHESASSPSSADHFPKRPAVKKKPKDYRLHVGLWQAHEDGVTPKILSRMASVASSAKEDAGEAGGDADETDASFQFSTADEEDPSRSMQRLRGSLSSLSWDEDEESVDHHSMPGKLSRTNMLKSSALITDLVMNTMTMTQKNVTTTSKLSELRQTTSPPIRMLCHRPCWTLS